MMHRGPAQPSCLPSGRRPRGRLINGPRLFDRSGYLTPCSPVESVYCFRDVRGTSGDTASALGHSHLLRSAFAHSYLDARPGICFTALHLHLSVLRGPQLQVRTADLNLQTEQPDDAPDLVIGGSSPLPSPLPSVPYIFLSLLPPRCLHLCLSTSTSKN